VHVGDLTTRASGRGTESCGARSRSEATLRGRDKHWKQVIHPLVASLQRVVIQTVLGGGETDWSHTPEEYVSGTKVTTAKFPVRAP
jgi:hypothetical protein